MLGAVLVAVVMAATASVAEGAEYKVHACGAAANYQNHLFSASVSTARMEADADCPTDGQGHNVGVAVRAGVNKGSVPVFANATQSFVAPAGTTIRHVHVKADGRAWNGDWASLLQGSMDRFERSSWNLSGCSGNPGSVNGCVSALSNLDQDYDLNGATGIRSIVACAHFAGCTTFSTGSWPFTRAYYFMREFDVTLDDRSVPEISVAGGGLINGQWVRGTQEVSYTSTDNSGVYRGHFSVDDLGVIGSNERRCDYTYAVPCAATIRGGYSFDTARVRDGAHQVVISTVDATNQNWAGAPRTIYVDNHAPAEPLSPSVAGGQGWRTTDDFTIDWTNPPSAAPVSRAFYEVCRVGVSTCATGSQTGSRISQLANIHVGQPGDYTIRVWLSDAAGNVSAAKSAPLHLKFDNVPPAQAAPQRRNGWINKNDAKRVEQQIDPNGSPPVSGIAGYAVTTDGSEPGSAITVPANGASGIGHTVLTDLPEGTTTIKARAISGAGVPSPKVGTTDLHVDLTPPVVALSGAPDPHRWSRTPARLHLSAVDPGQLSGMARGPVDRDVAPGGYVAYSIDGLGRNRVPGPERDLGADGRLGHAPAATADVVVDRDGPHTIAFEAADVAGNPAVLQSVSFKLDQAAPELAVFEPQQRADPRLVEVAASDRTSGLASRGEIRIRRIAPTSGPWIRLDTRQYDHGYFTRVDNTVLPQGDYEFQATVPDQAGNEATAWLDRQGRREVIHITPTGIGPYPALPRGDELPHSDGPDAPDAKATIATKVAAWAVERTVRRKKCKRRRGRPCPRPRVTESLVHDLRLPFGKRASIRGKLTTIKGRPLAGAEITVLARPSMAGGEYRAESSITTSKSGAFAYRAPVAPGRTLDFHYRGDDTYKHADDQVTLRVPAAVTIGASKRRVRNGRTVRFTGRLKGRPYPAKGKVLDLQAYYRQRWRTFATPRAGLSGKWTYRYRFQATRGSVLYRFRLRVRATSDYPYELGYSRSIKVRVIG